MGTPGGVELPVYEENQRLKDRISRLEEEVTRLHRSLEEVERRHSSGPQPESELQYKEVFDHISVCMFLIDVTSDGRFQYAGFNPAEEKALGLSTAEVSGKFVEEVFAEELARKLTGNYRRCMEAGTPITYDDELDLPGGRRYFHSNLIPMRNTAGCIHRIVGACIDTTDFKRTQEEAIAGQKLESLGVLAAGIAHDFNNLLGSILAEAELAESELAAGSSPGQEIQILKGVAIRAGEIVRELMIYAGQDEASLDPVDSSLLVEEMLALLKISISKHAILRVDLPENLPAVRANAIQIRQVVMNLITNASEALGDKEGVISVAISRVESGQTSIAGSPLHPAAGDYLRLTVSDTGTGMTDEVLSRIFDPFYTTKSAGRGLGLAAVQGIIRSHGGSINVSSAPGLGSRFEILLPCISQPVPDTRHPEALNAGDKLGCAAGTVLVVEDEPALRRAVSTILRREGFLVIEAGDGTAGTKQFCANAAQIDVILLDMTLPGMSGRQVLEEVRRIRPDVKVILTSAYSQGTLGVIGGEKPWGYIRKPYRISELTNVLRKAVGTPPADRASLKNERL
jgi:two-component system, cell cycle sensor histidine kinase and response regulator CckA